MSKNYWLPKSLRPKNGDYWLKNKQKMERKSKIKYLTEKLFNILEEKHSDKTVESIIECLYRSVKDTPEKLQKDLSALNNRLEYLKKEN